MSEIRLDRINNTYVIIAPERLRRPNNITSVKEAKDLKPSCPFCEGNEHLTSNEVFAIRHNEADMPGWQTRVVPNLYKAVQIELDHHSQRDGIFESFPGLGAHEILIDSPCHDCEMQELDEVEIKNWLQSIVSRMEDLQRDQRLIYMSVFKNVGRDAGATQEHPHTQLIALPVMPKDALEFLKNNMYYYQRHGRGLVEDILHNELLAQKRIVTQVGSFVAFCPYASSFPFEVMIAPKENLAALNRCSKKQLEELSILLRAVFTKLSKQLGSFDYNLIFSQAPLNKNFENENFMNSLDKNYRFIVRIIPRIYNFAGFELGTGTAINCMEPEECARLLRGEER